MQQKLSAAFFDAARSSLFSGHLLQPQVDGINAIASAWPDDGSLKQLAYVLATALHETAHTMQPISERGAVSYFAKYDAGTKLGRALGNTLPGDGYRFRGRGYVQLTGRANYVNVGRKIGVDLADNPDAAMDLKTAASIICDGMIAGWFTGKKLSDYISGSKADYIDARRIVNWIDRAALIAGYAEAFQVALNAI